MPARRDLPVWLCVSLLAAAALACNVPGVGQLAVTPTPTEEAGGVVTLEVVNQTDSDICVLIASPAGGASPGSNLLADAGPLSPGESWSTVIWPDRYNLLAGDCSNRVLGEEREVDLTAATAYTFAVGGAGAAGTSGAPDAQPQEVVVWIVEDCAPPAVGSQDEIVVRVAWVTTTLALAESNADSLSFVVRVDGQEVPGVEPIRYPALDSTALAELDCAGVTEAYTFVYWDLPIGPLPAGQHEIEVEFFADAEINDGFDTYLPGSLGSLERVIEVGEGAQAGSSGTVTGRICYPSDFIPAMTAYFEHIGTGQVHTLPIAENQQQYAIQLPPGPYVAYVWLPDGSIGGSYSHAVPCGLSEGCFNHSPLPFAVNAGQTTADIDICDWYGDPSDVPVPPGQ